MKSPYLVTDRGGGETGRPSLRCLSCRRFSFRHYVNSYSTFSLTILAHYITALGSTRDHKFVGGEGFRKTPFLIPIIAVNYAHLITK